MTTPRTEVILSAQDRASEVLRRLSGTVDGMQRSFDSISAPLLRFQGLWASLVGGAVVAGIRSLVSSIDDLDEAAQGLGTTAVELANLRQAAGEAGVGAETFDTALTRLNINLSEAAAGSKQQVALFKALGVNIRDAAGNVRPTTEVLADLAQKFSRLEDGPAKAALAIDLFGKAGARLIPLLNQGADGLARFAGLTGDTVKAATKLQSDIDKLNANFTKLGYTISSVAVPALNAFFDVANNTALGGAGENAQAIEADLLRAMGGATAGVEAYQALADRQRQVREALALGAGAYSNEGRAALQSAQAIRDKAAADAAAADATKRKTRATEESSNAYAKEFADVERIRRNRERGRLEIEAEEEAARQRRQQRVDDLTGRTAGRQFAQDLDLLTEKFRAAEITADEFDTAMRALFGDNSEIERGLERQADLSEQLGLTMASSLGELITAGGRAGDVWKALGQDIAKLITQLLIVKPLAAEITKLFSSTGGGGGGGGSGLFSEIFKQISGAVGGFFTGGGAAGASGAAAGAAGGQVFITNYIDGAVDRARISSYVENGVRAGLAQSWDNVARGGSGVLAG